MTMGRGSPETVLHEEDVAAIIEQGTPVRQFENKRVLVLTPDTTRTCPLPMMIRAIRRTIGERCARLDFMVALGTHTPMSPEAILALYGITDRERDFARSSFFNHAWEHPDTLQRIGTLSVRDVETISAGILSEEVPIEINRKIFEYDQILIVGPVFPHEVVGFSGGAKYLFPGISGGEFLHFFHWLAAVITCKKIIGIKDTPVRRVIDRAMEMVAVPVHLLAMVVNHGTGLCGLYAGHVPGPPRDRPGHGDGGRTRPPAGHGGQPRDGPVRAVRGACTRGLVAGGRPVRPHPHRDQAESV